MNQQDVIIAKADSILEGEDFEALESLFQEHKECVASTNELMALLFAYHLHQNCITIGDGCENTILSSHRNVQAVKDTIDILRRTIIRLEWSDAFELTGLPKILRDHNISKSEFSVAVGTMSYDSKTVVARLHGEHIAHWCAEPDYDYSADVYGKNRRIAFIACVNDRDEIREARYYIEQLLLPKGFEKEIVEVWEAPSICKGYNEGMERTDARYKVFFHQDVRIINPYFIYELVHLFESNESVGVVGMIGNPKMAATGRGWESMRYGNVLEYNIFQNRLIQNQVEGENQVVQVADGLLLATDMDLPWREDLFKGWDFYDASFCMECQRVGKEVVIPYQKTPWCIHDCGALHLDTYERDREIFLKEYR